jgi:peptidoglycan/LPS O-acetylase OafA/YrhL
MDPAKNYRPEIDGLRAVAVISVVLFHAGFPPAGGFLGVDVFFVISGYVITRQLLRDGASFSLARFYERRARRILPALLTVLLATSLLAYFALPPGPLIEFSHSVIAALLFVANIFFWKSANYFSEPSELTPLLHLWSLSVEEQFYLVFPLLLVGLRRFRPGAAGIAIAGIGIASIYSAMIYRHTDAAAVFYLAHFRAWQLAAGAFIAWREHGTGRSESGIGAGLGLGVVIATIFLADRSHAFAGSLAATAGSAAVVQFGGGRTWSSRLLSLRPVVGVGLISYSFYLWHQPLFALARSYAINAPPRPIFAALILISAALATATYRLIESPARRRWALKSFMPITTGAVCTVLACVAVASSGAPWCYNAQAIAILNASPERGVAYRDGRSCRRPINDACIIGNPDVQPSFAVLGDSHAETLTDPLSDLLRDRGVSAFVFTNAGCPYLLGVHEVSGTEHCAEKTEADTQALFDRNIKNVIINDRLAAYIYGAFDNGEGGAEPYKIDAVVPSGFKPNDPARLPVIKAALLDTLKRLLDAGITVYYILPVPEVGWHVPRTVVKTIVRGEPPPTTKLDAYLVRHRLMIDIAAELNSNPRFVSLFPHELLCSSGRCDTVRAGEILYTDYDHLSREGANIITHALAAKLKFPLAEKEPE